jgi:hypothetical protein
MQNDFKQLKSNRAGDAKRLAGLVRVDLGTHAKVKLRKAGCVDSGTLLHKKEAEKHAQILTERFNKQFEQYGKRGSQNDRLRMVTILDSVCELDLDRIINCVTLMEKRIKKWLFRKKIYLLAAVEIEIVNIDFLERVNKEGAIEKRKLDIIKLMTNTTGSVALVHFHGIIDLKNVDEKLLVKYAREIWPIRYAVELQKLYSSNSISKNIKEIFTYATKGGNEELRYKTGIAREAASDLDAKMWRSGTGRKDMGGEALDDERGLTIGEIRILDSAYSAIQKRKRGMTGYQIIKK